ncbi:hypothetical protein AU476_29950 [Cupriavidus sp. UYMSc13B]|nr:hypothetical protein AU476_29950 [Cupriavidus sp. UYMSc13B]
MKALVAYANIRKVIFMVVSTGAAEMVLFLLAIPLGLPMPLLPVQLLWLNIVTNGIQDVAVATEHAEGNELCVMIRRICYSTLVMGVGGFATFYWLLDHGYHIDVARNQLLLLFVLFESLQTVNSQSFHIAAMYIPGLIDTLRLTPVSATTWAGLLSLALTLTLAVELDMWRSRRGKL